MSININKNNKHADFSDWWLYLSFIVKAVKIENLIPNRNFPEHFEKLLKLFVAITNWNLRRPNSSTSYWNWHYELSFRICLLIVHVIETVKVW